MSHEIDTMAYVGETPWHKLGVNLGGENVTAKEMVAKAGLDWTVQKQPIHFMGEGKSVTIPDNYAIVRTDRNKALGVVGSVYTPLQNAKAFEFMDEIIGEGRAAYHTAGSLMGGRRVWVLVDMKNEAEIVPGDTVKSYALLTNGHDGRSMVDLTLTHTRVVCWNTLQEALSTKEKGLFFRIKHTANMGSRITEAGAALQTVSVKFRNFVQVGKQLAAKNITKKQLDEFLIRLEMERANEREAAFDKVKIEDFLKTDKYRSMVRDFETSPGNKMKGVRGTYWAAVNAVTYYVDHEASSRVTSNFKNVQEARFNSAMFNGGSDKKTRALSLALEMATKN